MKFLFVRLVFLIACLFTQTCWATVYYADKDSIGGACNNGGAGTLITAPWCSISKAASTLVAGDTVYIRAGTYYEILTPSKGGTARNPITYARYGSETVIIDGCRLSR